MKHRTIVPHQAVAVDDIRPWLDTTAHARILPRAPRDLVASVKENNVLQPVVVTKLDSGFELRAGRKRLAAAKELKKKTIEAVVLSPYPEALTAEIVKIIEQCQLGLMTDYMLAKASLALRTAHRLSISELADILGRSRGNMCNLARWHESMPEEVLQAWATRHPLINHAELERLSKLDKNAAREAWSAVTSRKSVLPEPAAKNKVRRASTAQILRLDDALSSAPLIPAVKKLAHDIVAFALGTTSSVDGVTNGKKLNAELIRR
jgi:ParB/RepB/Spo0J family partition protein